MTVEVAPGAIEATLDVPEVAPAEKKVIKIAKKDRLAFTDSEEKKSETPYEEAELAAAVSTPPMQTTPDVFSVTPTPPKVLETSKLAESPKQTLSGEAEAAAKVTPLQKKLSKEERKKEERKGDEGNNESEGPRSPQNNAYDDEDSSNDDSSYFADPSNLPSPGEAGRKYSFSSHHSATGTSGHNKAHARESDASLSLSEDSEDEKHRGYAKNQREAPEVFPQQRITRIHSVGSLVSTSSQNTDEDHKHKRDLNNAARERGYNNQNAPNGRLSPVHGAQLLYSYPPGHPMPQGAPPAMMSHYGPYGPPPHAQDYAHAQAQMATTDQWLAAMTHPHGATGKEHAAAPPHIQSNSSSGWSDGTLKYSEDGDMDTYQQGMRVPAGANRGVVASNGKAYTAQDSRKKNESDDHDEFDEHGEQTFKVYWQRWVMLFYMSILNLLSDWTCYSVAPIAVLTQEAFGDINPEELVVVFLGANAVASASEPIILSRLGLRRTVLFGALLLMVGSIIKSGGMPPIIQADLEKGHGEWRVYLGFFLVGLSQPLYQCTPALLSASWFPEHERTMATGVALNANQLGIGFAFVFGTLLVSNSDDIPAYFGLLSIVSTLAFFGTLFQFDDAPPTPPSDTARVIRGTLDMKLPSVSTILQSVGVGSEDFRKDVETALSDKPPKSTKHKSGSGKSRRSSRSSSGGKKHRHGPPASGERRKSKSSSRSKSDKGSEAVAPAPSPAQWDTATDIVAAPSPMMPGNTGPGAHSGTEQSDNDPHFDQQAPPAYPYGPGPVYPGMAPGYPMPPNAMPPNPQTLAYGYSPYQMPYYDPRFQQPYMFAPPAQQQFYQPPPQPSVNPYYATYHQQPSAHQQRYSNPYAVLPPAEAIDEGAEPVLTITPHHLDIDIRDDQIILSLRACMARPGFIHSLVSFTVSGIVINTLSTFMDYLVRLNGAGREYTGIVGGTFQFAIMMSSLIIGGLTDRSRAYYTVTIGMLVIGAFGLAECGVSLNADRGSDLRIALVMVAILVGPLQPVSTELGVEVVYPLSENTVLVIQQLFSNLLSALFIPCFKRMKDLGITPNDDTDTDQPEYTFSFYMLILLHAAATVFFATFNGRYLRYEHELEKKEAKESRKRMDADGGASVVSVGSYHGSVAASTGGFDHSDAERQPLMQQTNQAMQHPIV